MLNARGLSEVPLLAKPYTPYSLKPYAEMQALQACGSCITSLSGHKVSGLITVFVA